VASNPPYLGETNTNENFEEMLFSMSTRQRSHDLIAEEEGDFNFEDYNSSAKEELDLI